MPGLLRGVARTAVVAGTATAVSNRVSRRQRGRWAEKDQQAEPQDPQQQDPQQQDPQQQDPQQQDPQQQNAQQQNAQQQQPPPAAGMDDRIAQLKALGDLRSQGVLSEAEFEAQKRLILGT
jgi:hypothetical protein